MSNTPTPAVTHAQMANAIRFLAVDAVEKAKSGHPGMPMGMADVATVLFTKFLKYDPADAHWPDRDRFVLSAGHGSMLIYALLYLTGYPEMTIEEIKRFRQIGSKTPGHPEYGHTQGVETTTGPLGQGIATSVGMAIAERMLAARFGEALVDHYTYVLAGDGCLAEGVSHEAIDLAGNLSLGRLIVFWDDNGITIDGATSLSTSTDQVKRFAASGWHTGRRWPRSGGRGAGDSQGQSRSQTLDDRLPHDHRLWHANAPRHRGGAQQSPRPDGGSGDPRGPGLAACAFRDPGADCRGLAEGGTIRREVASGLARAPGGFAAKA
jgi:transketolase N-terminal domain/subunit